jgi:type IV pilus secretin PilQ/predicted competence protein
LKADVSAGSAAHVPTTGDVRFALVGGALKSVFRSEDYAMTSKRNNLKNVMGVLLAFAAGTTVALAQDTTENPALEPAAPAAEWAPAAPADAAQPESNADAQNAPANEETSNVVIDDNMTVDLHVKDEDLANVLEMLSIQSQKNIIASKDVQARVTANLYGVTFYEALDAILNVNGYGFIEEGNFIKIYTLDELAKKQIEMRNKVSKVITLSYMNSVDAAEFVKPLLSPDGQIKVNSKAGTFTAAGETPSGAEDYAHGSLLVVYDYEENVAQVEEMVRLIDTRPAQVLVEATVLQTQLNEANALGVDFSVVADMSFTDYVGTPLQAVNSILAGNSDAAVGGASQDRGASGVGSTVGNVAQGAGGLKVGIVSNDVGVFIRALDEVTDTTVLSNPKIMTLNRQSGRVLVGRKVGYLNTTATDTSTTQSVEFLDTGTSLYFRPFVTTNGLIRMEVKPKVAEAAIRQISDIGGNPVTIPDEITNEITTNILVRDGQTVVLGGLFRENVTVTRKQVPVLGDIPFIGNAFRGHDDSTNRNEIIFLITPTIVDDAMITESGARGSEYVDRIVAGSREGTLFWSRDRITNNLNIEAERLAREGDTAGALNKAERSLGLNPGQPEMIQMRERLTGKKAPTTNRSFLDRVINKEAAENLLQVQAEELSSNTTDTTQQFNQTDVQPTFTALPEQLAATEGTDTWNQNNWNQNNNADFNSYSNNYNYDAATQNTMAALEQQNQNPVAQGLTEPTNWQNDQLMASTLLEAVDTTKTLPSNFNFTGPYANKWNGPTGFTGGMANWYTYMLSYYGQSPNTQNAQQSTQQDQTFTNVNEQAPEVQMETSSQGWKDEE